MSENFSNIKLNKDENKDKSVSALGQLSNPLTEIKSNAGLALTDYSQTISRKIQDKELTEILEVVRILNNMAPIKMPEYNFNIEEINGEHYYRPDGSLLLIREYDSNIIRDYYTKKDGEDGPTISRILEHEKDSGRLKTKIEPITRKGSRLTTNITIFDLKINNIVSDICEKIRENCLETNNSFIIPALGFNDNLLTVFKDKYVFYDEPKKISDSLKYYLKNN